MPLAPPTPRQLQIRGQIEALIRLAAPGLDLLLAAGDRLARVVEPGDPDPQLAPPVQSQRAIAGQVRRG
jgi:hypothetical protein